MTNSLTVGIRCWRPAAMGLLFVAALFLSLAVSPAEVANAQLGQDEQAVVDLINAHRANNGLSPLNVSSTLTDVALWMSQDMAEKDYFSHTDSLGRDPFERMADFGYDYNTWKGENLAAGSDTPQMTFQLWRDSPGHNANMLNPNFVVVGLAKAYGPNSTYGWYWSAEFGGLDDGDAYTNAHADAHADTHANTDAHADANPYAHAHTGPYPHARAAADELVSSYANAYTGGRVLSAAGCRPWACSSHGG